MNQLTCWPLLNKLNVQFLSNVSQFMSLGQNGSCLLLICKDDSVHGYGYGDDGILGLGSKFINIIKEPQELIELRNKKIVQMVQGTSHVLALSQNGLVWSWGQNESGQLGIGSVKECFRPRRIPDCSFENDWIVSIKCDSHYSMALSKKGVVYQWGWLSDLINTRQTSPCRVLISTMLTVVQIACSYSHSMALTSTGLVYVWGSNVYGKLGTHNFVHEVYPVPITVNTGSRVKQIACGMEHSLLLTDQGHCYSFGSNFRGQLGISTPGLESDRPTMVVDNQMQPYKFWSIAAYQRMSAAVSVEDNYCYVWGETATRNLFKLSKTPLISIDCALGFYSVTHNTRQLVKFNGQKNINKLVLRLSALFNNAESGDLQIECDQKPPYSVSSDEMSNVDLSNQSSTISPPTDHDWLLDRSSNRLTIIDYPYPVCHAYLQHLYTNRTDPLDQSHLIQLLDLALFNSETELQKHCTNLLCTNHLSVDNCCQFYQLAVRNQLSKLKNNVVLFFGRNILRVCKTQSFCSMDDHFCKMLALDYAHTH